MVREIGEQRLADDNAGESAPADRRREAEGEEQSPDEVVAQLLRALPKERLVALVTGAWGHEEIGRRLATLRGGSSQVADPRAALERLTRDDLTTLVIATGKVNLARARLEFDEYRFSSRPSLYLRHIPAMLDPANLEAPGLRQRLDEAFGLLNDALINKTAEPPSRDFAIEAILDPDPDGLIEIRYRVLHRIDLVDPDDLRPSVVYTAHLGAAWLDPTAHLCLINAPGGTDADHIAGALAQALAVGHLWPVTLTDDLLEEVVEEEKILSGSFTAAAGDGPRSIRYGDAALSRLHSYKTLRADTKYRPTSSYYRQEMRGAGGTARLGVGFTRRSGHIWIPYPLARTTLVEWAKAFMAAIAGRQAHFLASDISKAAAAREDALVKAMPDAWNKPGIREAVLAIVAAAAECLGQARERFPIPLDTAEPIPVALARSLRRHVLAIGLEGTCENCGQPVEVACGSCSRTRFGCTDMGRRFACAACDHTLDLTHAHVVRCQCGADVSLNPERDLTLAFDEEFHTETSKLLHIVGDGFDLVRHLLIVEGTELRVLRDRTAARVLYLDDVMEFKHPAEFGFYDEAVQRQVEERLARGEAGKEKCAPFAGEQAGAPASWPCDRCAPHPHHDRECLRTIVIDRIGRGKVEPHTGTEIGDLVFQIMVDGVQRNVIGFGKRHTSELRSTNAEGRELMAQI